jgi:hypothetical protein
MKDGFQKWAESERPAREGGSEKVPCEYQTMKRGAGIFDSAQIVADMGRLYSDAKAYTPAIKKALRNKEVQGHIANGKYAGTMEDIAKYMELVGLGHQVGKEAVMKKVGGSKNFKEWLDEVKDKVVAKVKEHKAKQGGRIGMSMPYHHDEELVRSGKGKGRGIPDEMVKGAGLLDSGKKVYDWLKAHKQVIHGILDSPYMNEKNPAGATDVPKRVSGVLTKVGLGKRAPSAYAQFVKQYAAENPGLGKSLMSEAAKAWKASK